MRKLSLVRGGMVFALLASFLVFGSSDYSYASTPAAGSCSQATGSWICNVQDQNLSFNETASITQGGAGNHIDPANGEAVVYKNVFTDGSVVINARLTVTEKSDEIIIDKYDAGVDNLGIWTSVGSGTDDDTNTSFTIEFFEASSGEGVRLLNVEILVKDLDGADAEEFAAAWGLNSYVVTTDTVLDVATVDPVPVANPTTSNPGAENPTPETGVRQFLNEDKVSASSAINTPDQEAWVGMKFDSVLSIRIEAGGRDSGSGLIGFEFTDIDAAFTDATQEISVVDASYTVTYNYNNNPCGTAVPSPTTFTGAQSLSQGTEMSGAGVNLLSWNTKADGTGVTYALGSSYTAVDDITLYAQWSGAPCPPLFGGCDFDNRTTADGLGHNIQLGVYVDGDRVYAATNDGLSISTDGGKAGSFTNYTTANGLGNNKSRGAFIDGSVLYVPTQGGLSISTSLDNSDVSADRFTTRTVANSTLGNNYTRRAVVVDSTLYVGTNGGLSISTNGGDSFTNRTTANGLGHNAVWDVHVAGTNVYAATSGGLSISTDSGATFRNLTTSNGLGSNELRAVYASGSTVYAATQGGLSISATCGTISSDSSDSGGGTDPGIFLNVAGPVGESA
ncbi:MAG: InlB B-repeat-containing protein, partial [Pontimonas sp.]